MKIKFLTIALGTTALFASCTNNEEKTVEATEAEKVEVVAEEIATELTIDSSSTVTWYAAHVGKDLKGDHYGKIELTEGSFSKEGENIVTGKFVADLNQITVEDLNDDEEKLSSFLDHIKKDDFFDAQNHPNIIFEITKVENLASPDSLGNNANISGNLTIKGTSKNITFPAVLGNNSDVVTMNGEVMINQADWGILEGLINKGMIQDQFTFIFDIKANKL